MTDALFYDARRRLVFCALFGLHALFMAYTLDRWDAAFSLPWLQAISYSTSLLLELMGVTVSLGAVPGDYAILSMNHVVFHVTRECTGVYALGLYVAAVLSYPATLGQRFAALAWCLQTFFGYSIARLVLLAVIAAVAPDWTGFLNIYLLVIVTAGFLLWLWATWVNHLPSEQSSLRTGLCCAARAGSLPSSHLSLPLPVWDVLSAYYMHAIVWLVNSGLALFGSGGLQLPTTLIRDGVYPGIAGAIALFMVTPRQGWRWKLRWVGLLMAAMFALHAGVLLAETMNAVSGFASVPLPLRIARTWGTSAVVIWVGLSR